MACTFEQVEGVLGICEVLPPGLSQARITGYFAVDTQAVSWRYGWALAWSTTAAAAVNVAGPLHGGKGTVDADAGDFVASPDTYLDLGDLGRPRRKWIASLASKGRQC